jgi:hypothetical protein
MLAWVCFDEEPGRLVTMRFPSYQMALALSPLKVEEQDYGLKTETRPAPGS